MPVKFVVLGVIVVVAAGIAVYENEDLRHNISDFFDRQRRKLAQHLHDLADNVHGHQASPHQASRMHEPMAVGSMMAKPMYTERAKTSGMDDMGEGVELKLRARQRGSDGDYYESSEKSGQRAKAAAAATAVAAAAMAGVSVAAVSGNSDEEKTEKESGYESGLTSATLPPPQQPLPQQQQQQQEQPAEQQPHESDASVIFSAAESFKALSESSAKTISADTENPFSDNHETLHPPQPQQQQQEQQPYWHIQQWAENTLSFDTDEDAMSEPSISSADVMSEKGSEGSGGSEFEDVGSVASWTEVGSEVSGDGH